MNSTLLHGGRVLAADGTLSDADVLIRNGLIASVAAPGSLDGADAGRMDAGDCMIAPGFVNGHTHSPSALGRGGVPDRISLEGFLAYGPAITGKRSTEDVYLSARLHVVELARNGITSCIDMAGEMPVPTVEGLLAVGRAYAEVGVRGIIAPMITDRTLYEAYPEMTAQLPEELRQQALAAKAPDAATLLAIWREANARWPFDRSIVQLGLGPSIPLHCTDQLLAGCAALSREFDAPMQTHVLESRLQALAQGKGESVVRRLQRLGCLTPRTSLAHGVWLDDDDMEVIAASGATVSHNPTSNLRLGSGVARLRKMLDAGVKVAIGSDGSNTSDGQNMFQATRLASYLTRVASPKWSDWVECERVHALATGGATVAAGQPADLVLIDLAQPHYVPLRRPMQQMVMAESGSGLKAVLVAGRTVFANGRVAGVDEAALRVQAQERAEALDAAAAPARKFADAAHPVLAAFCCGYQPVRFPRDEDVVAEA